MCSWAAQAVFSLEPGELLLLLRRQYFENAPIRADPQQLELANRLVNGIGQLLRPGIAVIGTLGEAVQFGLGLVERFGTIAQFRRLFVLNGKYLVVLGFAQVQMVQGMRRKTPTWAMRSGLAGLRPPVMSTSLRRAAGNGRHGQGRN